MLRCERVQRDELAVDRQLQPAVRAEDPVDHGGAAVRRRDGEGDEAGRAQAELKLSVASSTEPDPTSVPSSVVTVTPEPLGRPPAIAMPANSARSSAIDGARMPWVNVRRCMWYLRPA